MVGFILTGHGHFANGLKSALDMVAGDQEAFTIVPFEGSAAATYGDDLRAAITAMRAETDGVLVFVDLLGGTPFNQAMLVTQEIPGVRVITGTNLPMLLECLFVRNANGAMTVDEVTELALEVGPAGIVSKAVDVDHSARAADDFDGEGL